MLIELRENFMAQTFSHVIKPEEFSQQGESEFINKHIYTMKLQEKQTYDIESDQKLILLIKY